MTDQLPPTTAPTTSLRRPVSLYWPGFVAGFLLLSSLSCGALFMATGVTRFDLADFQAGESRWTPPPTLEAVAVAPETSQLPEQMEDGYGPGEQLRNITSSLVNLRASPGYLGKPQGDILAQVPPGGRVEILGERAVADNLVWWRIRYTAADGAVVEGWIAEATASGVQILGQ